jgi:AraC-like DNA-binding protein
MLLEAWYQEQKNILFDDSGFKPDQCLRSNNQVNTSILLAQQVAISMQGCFIMYVNHRSNGIEVVRSRQDSNIAILSFQLNGNMNVNEKNFEPYRIFENDVHNTFFTNKRELIFEAPAIFENFRIILSPEKFLELLSKYHGRFSEYNEPIRKGISFNLYDKPLPITPKMKMIIHDIISHHIQDTLLSKVYYETKISEIFGCQLEQVYSSGHNTTSAISPIDRQKIYEIREILTRNLHEPPPTIPKLARFAGINENKLKKAFKAVFGKSIYHYLLVHRMEKAVELMENQDLPLEEIANRVGYGDSAHFSRAFRKLKGIPPGQYRKVSGEN